MPEPNSELAQEEEKEEAVVDAGSTPEKRSLGTVLLIAGVLLIPAAAGAAIVYSQYPQIAERAAAASIQFQDDDDPDNKPVQYGHFVTLTDLLINPAGTGGKGFLVVSIGLETKSSSVIAEIEEKEIVIRDAILQLLSEHTHEELAAIEQRSALKDEIIGELNQILQKGDVDRLYFTQFLLQ